jgi:hypothetical protein
MRTRDAADEMSLSYSFMLSTSFNYLDNR